MYFHWPTAGEHMDLLLTLGGNGSSLIWTKRTVSTNGFFSRSYLLIDLNEKSFVTVMDEACVHPFTIFTQTTASFINDKLHLREIRLSNKKKNWRAYFKSKNGNRERSEMKNCHFLCAEYAVFCKTNIEVFLLTSYFFSLCYPTARHDGPNNKKLRLCVGFIRSQYLKKKRISRLWKRENTKASLCLRSSLADARRDALQGKFHTFYLHFVIKSIRRFRITFEQYNHFFFLCMLTDMQCRVLWKTMRGSSKFAGCHIRENAWPTSFFPSILSPITGRRRRRIVRCWKKAVCCTRVCTL